MQLQNKVRKRAIVLRQDALIKIKKIKKKILSLMWEILHL